MLIFMKYKMPKKYSSLAIAGLVFSLIFFVPFFSIIGLVCGIVALSGISKNTSLKGKGIAIAAVIIGAVVTLVYLVAIFLFYKFVAGISSGIGSGSNGKIDDCLNQKSGLTKDLCIFVFISAHINQTDSLDKNICDNEITYPDLKDSCNAVLKRDKSYCDNIKTSDARLKCYGLIDELERNKNLQAKQ